MPPQAWIALALFVPLLLVGCLHLLAASGHFPAEHRSEPFKSGSGRALLLGSMAIVVACVGAGLVLVWRAAPWYFVVIGGGLAILAAPLALRPLPDSFVDGRAALVVLAGAAAALALLMGWLVAGASAIS